MKIQKYSAFLVYSLTILFLLGCNSNSNRKIKLSTSENKDSSDVQTVSSTIRVSPEEQNSIAIFYFENGTNDTSLNWLQRGITDMLEAELSQSPYYNVIPVQRILDVAQKHNIDSNNLHNVTIALEIARLTNAESILTGRYYHTEDQLNIDLHVIDVASTNIIRTENVTGTGLEQIFVMVNDLSDRIRTDLRGKLALARARNTDQKPKGSEKSDVSLIDMTKSVKAYRCFSLAKANIDKFLWREADNCLQEALEYDSTFAEVYIYLAKVKKEIGDRKGAKDALMKAEKFSDKLSKTGQIQLKLVKAENKNDLEQLISVMDEMLQYAPYDIEIRNQLASLLMGLKKYDESLQQYEYILELDPTKSLVYNQIGYIYAHRGDFTNAFKYMEKYKEMAPDEANPHDSLGEILLMAGKFKKSAEQYELALKIRPDFYFSSLRLTRVYSELGDFTNALKYSDNWMDNAPNEARKFEGLLERALLHWRFDKIDEAEKILVDAIQKSPYSRSAVSILGELYKAKNENEKAEELYLAYFYKNKDYFTGPNSNVGNKMSFIQYCLEMNIPPSKVIPIAKTLYEKEESEFNKSGYAQMLGILHSRNQEFSEAENYFQDLDLDFADALMQIPRVNWNDSGWKYAVEMIQRQPKQDNPSYKYFEKMIKKAEKSNRQDIEIYTRYVTALAKAKNGDTAFLENEYKNLGTPLENTWRVIGPFIENCGFVCKFPPEEKVAFPNTENKLSDQWQPVDDGANDGYIDLKSIFDKVNWAVAYGSVYVKSPSKRVVQIRVSSDESCKLWFNDDLVWQIFRLKEDAPLDNDIVSVVLKRGYNKILIKTTNSLYNWGFNLRVTDENGEGIPDLDFYPTEEVEGKLASSY
jgi:tetratricopeptide (TPR) repeat protein